LPINIEGGLRDVVKEAVAGAVLSAALSLIPKLGVVQPEYVGIFQLIELTFLVGGILAISKMESMGIGYLIGWLFGAWIMSNVGLVESWLFTLYAVVGTVVLIGKILRKARL